jgi:hypothetical protein
MKQPLAATGDIPVTHHLQALDDMLTGAKKPLKQMHKALDELMLDPAVDDRVKNLARDLYDLPVQLPIEIARAANNATERYILGKLINQPGVVTSVPKPGYVKSKNASIKGMFIDKDIELELEAMQQLKQEANSWYQKWFLAPWKTAKVTMRPAGQIRNMIGNLVLNDVGGLPFYRVDKYMSALRDMREGAKKYKKFAKTTGIEHTFAKEEIGQIAQGLRYGATMPEKLLDLFDHIAAPTRNLYSGIENWFKYTKYLHNMDKGMGHTEAAMDALKWTFNYGEITPLIRKVRSSPLGAPFITFQSKVIPLMAEAAIKHPLRVGKWAAMGTAMTGYALDKLGMSEEEWEGFRQVLPNYLQGRFKVPMPYRGEDGALRMLDMGW